MPFANKISAYNRKRKWKLFINEFSPNENMKVLDVGFSDSDYSPVANFIEKYYPYPEKLTALGIDTPNNFSKRYPKIRVVQYDGNVFPFKDKAFDICWSNAVIEHVGNFDNQLFFIKEINRISKRAFLTTPNKYFPIEPHTRTPFLHYLPKEIFDTYLSFIGKKWAAGDYMRLLSINDIIKFLKNLLILRYPG